MNKKFICFLAVIILAICLLSGGCSSQTSSTITDWKDLLKMTSEKSGDKADPEVLPSASNTKEVESISIDLYFAGPDKAKLGMEQRSIPKVEGVARQTMVELLKGPQNKDYKTITPPGTRLLDINLKPDGLCIVDLSAEARQVANQEQAEIMVQAIANTLGQFSTVKRIDFMIDGNRVDSIGNYVMSSSIEPDYSR